jgi:type I restriction enzyme M protein
MYLHGVKEPQIFEYDSLTSEDHWNEYSDVILANPPFMSPKGGIRPHKRFSVQSNRSEVLFVDYIAEHLTQDGRAAVIIPEGIIFQSGIAYKQLRKMLVERYLVGVISLPAGVFNPYSGVKTSILWLDKSLAKKTDKILFLKIENDGFDLGAQRRAVKGNDLPNALQRISDYKDRISFEKQSNFETETNISLIRREEISGSDDYNLSGERYKKLLIINSDYPIVSLGETAEVIAGQSPSGEYYNEDGVGMPFYQGKTGFGTMYLGVPQKWTTQVTKEAIEGDILMSVRAPVGPVNFATQQICIGRGLAAIRSKDIIHKKFLYYLLKSKEGTIKGNGGAVFDSISKAQIEDIKIPLPPLSIQKEIVADVDSYQKIIDGARQVVENYKPRIDIDPAWEIVELGEVCYVKGGKRVPKGESFSENKTPFPYIRVTDLREMSVDLSGLKYIPKSIQSLISRYIISKEDVYISIAGTIGLFGTIPDQLDGANLTENAAKLVIIDNKLDRFYLTFIGNSQVVQAQIKKLTHAVGVPKLALERIKSIEIPIPPIEVQRKISKQIIQELAIVDANKQMMQIFEQKIKDRIAKVWGGPSVKNLPGGQI